MSGAGKVVCVTGGSGFIASWLIKLLLEREYTVRATVRSLSDPRKTEHLRALDGAKERLHLFEANLIEEGSFDSAIDGCDGVFHTAAPVLFSASDPQAEIIEPVVKGTLNVLGSCAKFPSIKRVVVTSSMAAVTFNRRPLGPDVVIDESWFSDSEFCKESKLWYMLSKTLAEEAGWKFAKEKGIDLVTLHPGLVIGPLLQPTLNLTSAVILSLIKSGKDISSKEIHRSVDVRDVAYAHIQAFEIPSASGRYCLVETVTYSAEVVKILHKLYPSLNLRETVTFSSEALEILHKIYAPLKLPERGEDEKPTVPPYQVSKVRAKSLGIDFIPLEICLKDSVDSLKDKNFLSF